MRITTRDNLRLYTLASQWIGTPYRFGGISKRGVDCSGFAIILYREVYGSRLAASSADILKYNCKKIKRPALREGDLVFFRTDRGNRKTPNHVGIYLKNDKFVHASTSRGVIVSSLSEPYYLRSWITGGRVR
jgi:lipoprotein Spr